MAEEFFDKLKKIKAFFFDVDGVLTDGNLLLLEDGEWLRRMNIRDGFAIKHAIDERYKIGVISGSGSEAITRRMNALGVSDVYLLTENKLPAYEKFLLGHNIGMDESLYMGDDIPDLGLLKRAGFAACPKDAVAEVKAVSHYITEAKGGEGAVREVIEMVRKLQGQWNF
jgi:3-deoxy-D-manno-octulosonate 8-phosphate phosphatase (KDO 8-P phosphatase)